MVGRKLWYRLAWMLCALVMCGCSATRHVPEGSYLLDKVDIVVDDRDDVEKKELYNFLRQVPNHKVLGFARLQLATYSLSGSDSTRWYNRMLRRVGQPPVLYDHELTDASVMQLRLAMVNRGFTHATVSADTLARGKRMGVVYHIGAGEPHVVSSVGYSVPDTTLRRIIATHSRASLLRPGILLDRNVLDNERTRVTRLLRNAGYYDFTRDNIVFDADTVAGSRGVDLTFRLASRKFRRYVVRNVTYVVDNDIDDGTRDALRDTVRYRDITILYGKDRYLRPQVLDEMCYIVPGKLYSAREVERTYEALGRLAVVKFINIELEAAGDTDDTSFLDAYIYLARNKKQNVSVEVEGTNSEGDLGFGVGLAYQHRNIAKGSELLSAKFRTNYESLSGDFDGLINKRYTEYAGEVGITFPKFECPFLSKSFKQRLLASTEFTVSANYQERPEYTRVIFGTAWKWKWQQQRSGFSRRQTFDLIDINYVRLPRSTINFIDEIAPENPLLRYSYEDHFIMRMGYTYSRTNRRMPGAQVNARYVQPYVTTLRVSGETAGNLLYGISHLVRQHRSDGVYKVLGIQYAQYVKGEADFTYTRNFSHRTSLSWHTGLGIAFPYGNSTMVPFEKRFYAGGANGVRGWGVRTLGPGSYDAKNSVTDFINQCGDIRLDLSLEFRAKLFWVIEGAVFVDAGNVWTIRDYENQPGGLFRFNTFYKQIAAAYGLGIRLDFTYFLLRLDLGMKAHNPAMNQERWPIIHPRWGRDANFHFSVGYPF